MNAVSVMTFTTAVTLAKTAIDGGNQESAYNYINYAVGSYRSLEEKYKDLEKRHYELKKRLVALGS